MHQENSNRIEGLMEINKASDDGHNFGQQPQPKKQVRRRLHTSKPYQERLLNMAEARREIATALKFHRASMKQQQQQQTAANHGYSQEMLNSGRHPTTATANHWPTPPPPPLVQENLDLILPNKTLGLNLNFKDFNNLYTSIYCNPIPVASSTAEVAVVNLERWCKSLGSNEVVAEDNGKKAVNCYEDDDDDDDDEYYHHPFEQVMEFPPWLINANENSSFQHLLDHHFSEKYSSDPALPWMDIGEIEGMDGEWLA